MTTGCRLPNTEIITAFWIIHCKVDQILYLLQEIFSNYDEVAAVDEAKPVFSDLEDDTWEGDGDYYEGS